MRTIGNIVFLISIGVLFFGSCSLLGGENEKPVIPGKMVFSMHESEDGEVQVYKMNTDGSGLKKLTNFKDEGAFEPSWSPDGKQIVFLTSKMAAVHFPAIFLMNADGSNTRPMKVYPELPYLAYGGGRPVWSPDGTRIAFEACGNCGGQGGQNFELLVYDFATDSITRITDNYWIDRNPAWSPDGSKLAFTSGKPYAGSDIRGFRQDIYTVSLDDGELTRITYTGDAVQPNWSPDGKFISYATILEKAQAYLFDLETNEHWLLFPEFKVSGNVQWSRSGEIMAVQTAEGAEITDEIRFYRVMENELELLHVQKNPYQVRANFKWYYDENN